MNTNNNTRVIPKRKPLKERLFEEGSLVLGEQAKKMKPHEVRRVGLTEIGKQVLLGAGVALSGVLVLAYHGDALSVPVVKEHDEDTTQTPSERTNILKEHAEDVRLCVQSLKNEGAPEFMPLPKGEELTFSGVNGVVSREIFCETINPMQPKAKL